MAISELFTFKRPEITRLFKQARRIYRSRELDILSTPKSKEYARLLIITPKKIGNAPQRNKIKRRLRALFYENRLFYGITDMAVIIKKEGANLSFDELKKRVTSCAKLPKK